MKTFSHFLYACIAVWLISGGFVCEPKSKQFKSINIFYANTSTTGLNENIVTRFKQVLDSAKLQKSKIFVLINDGIELQTFTDEDGLKNITSYLYENASAPVNYLEESKLIREFMVRNKICATEKLNLHFLLSEYCYTSVMQFKSDYSLQYFYHHLPVQLKELCASDIAVTTVTTFLPSTLKNQAKVKEIVTKNYENNTTAAINYNFQSL